jgi:hypothetical protein
MAKLLRAAILIAWFFSAGTALAGTHYIAANGSDSSSGTSKTSPWLHAPGMTGCSGNCASYTPVPGDQFIFRGGDSWHYSTGSPIGLPWTWTWSGNSTSGIYLGVDLTWFSGGSFARPILTMDNPLSTVLVNSCTYDDLDKFQLNLSNVSYVTLDDFEFTGKCWSGNPNINPELNTSLNIGTATHSVITRNYFHGWSSAIGSIDTHRMIRGILSGTASFNEMSYNVIDGGDSFHGTTTATNQCAGSVNGPPCASGFAVYGDGYNFHHNILRNVSNGIVTNGFLTVHDNLFENMWNSYVQDPLTHPNVIESGNTVIPGIPFYFYNNVVRHTRQNVTMWVEFDQQMYMFNNVFFDNFGGSIDCIEIQPGYSTSTPVLNFYDNTIDASSTGNGTCTVSFNGGSVPAPWQGTANFRNNHFIGYSPSQFSSVWTCQGGASCSATNDQGNEVFQTEAVANGQGYTAANNYQPTSGGATIGASANLTSSCSTFSADSALCNGTSLGVVKQAGQGGLVAVSPAVPIIPRPSSGAWDAGAYQYSSGSSGLPNPPSALTATVH